MKNYNRILAYVFIIIIFGFFISTIIMPDKTFSDLENRTLSQIPKFSIDSLLDGRFTIKFESYFNDQFPLRDNLVTLKTSIDSLLGKSENNGVYIGKDNNLYEQIKKPIPDSTNANIQAVNTFAEKYKDIKTTFMLVPNAATVYPDILPDNAPSNDGLKYINDIKSELTDKLNFINPYDTLYSHRDEYLYYRTDHHWTTLGAYYGYQSYCEADNIKAKTLDDYDKNLISSNFYGTLFSRTLYKKTPADQINIYTPKDNNDQTVVNFVSEKQKTASLYSNDALDIRDKYSVFLGGNHPLVKIDTTAKLDKERKLLIIKDSYANSFVPFLTSNFSEITLVDPRYYYDDIDKLIADDKYTDVLFLYNANTFFEDNSLSSVLNNN